MEKFNELLEKLKSLNIKQKSIDWIECIPDEIWDEHFKDNFMEIKSGINVDKHRWYETSTSVVSIYGKLLGIKHVTDLFSESMSCEDCYETIDFFEMKEVTVTSYVKI